MLQAVRPHFLNRHVAVDLAFLSFLVLAWLFPQFGDRVLRPLERFGARFAKRKRLAVFSVALAAVLVRGGLLVVSPAPVPHFHDEFSYLLAGDTFAHGRLTNPPHPMSFYLETIHVNQRPTYMSKYPPAQGAALAVGELLGNPWFGVVLSVSGMCAAILWMLQGWLPPAWALLGALLVFLRLGISSYWVNSYWGGAVAAIGGALVVGALPRILRWCRPRDAVILGLGAAILANSRPFEGFFLCLPVAVVILVWLFGRRSPAGSVSLRRLILPFSLVVLLAAVFIGYYNWRVTGSALLPPYLLNQRTYWSTPTFVWQKERPPMHFAQPQLDAFYNAQAHASWLQNRPDTLAKFWSRLSSVAGEILRFFMWPELCLPLLALPWMFRSRRARFLFVQFVVCFFALFLVPWFFLHYLAPITACIFALVVQGTRHLRLWNFRGRPVGIGLSRVMVLFALIPVLLRPQGVVTPEPPAGIEYRAKFEAQLNGLPGAHLAIVHYSADHNVHAEWVYNRADIDAAKIVWARDFPGRELRPLFNYFRGRQIWLVEPDLTPPRLTPYSDLHYDR
jgi:hypothetical protein